MKKSWGKISFAVTLGFMAIVSLPTVAMAQSSDLQTVLNRMERLERDIKTLSQTVYKGKQPPASALSAGGGGLEAAQAGVRITELEDEFRNLVGMVESLAHDIRTTNSRIDKFMADVDFRLSGGNPQVAPTQSTAPQVTSAPSPQGVTVEQTAPVMPTGKPASTFGQITEAELKAVADKAPPLAKEDTAPGQAVQAVPQTQTSVAAVSPQQITATPVQAPSVQATPVATQPAVPTEPKMTVTEQYNNARKFLMKGNFDEAEVALTEFLQAHPEDKLAGNARYWLGETHYVRGDYFKAAQTFLEGYKLDPKGNKAADGLLKLGMALGNLDKKREACATFSKLGKEFPRAPAKIKKAADRAKKRNGC